jgi:hypothetical protein
MKIKNIIKILPFDRDFQLDLLNRFDSLEGDERYNTVQLLMEAYYMFYRFQLEENLGKALIRVRNGEIEIGENFYRKIREQTEKDMESNFEAKTADVDIAAIRAKLEAVINEHKQQTL